ncbi:tetratricopeptide repeat protein [bacterium]|nr:tetratricopeptide repeat protein [bacterium]
MSSKTNDNYSLSSFIACGVMSLTLLALLFLPALFSVSPANLKSASLMLGTIIMGAVFLLTTIRRKRLFLNLSPLSGYLIFFSLALCLSVLTHHFFYPAASLVGYAGLFITFCLLSLLSSTLLKFNNAKILIKVLLGFGLWATFTTILALINANSAFLPTEILSAIYTPELNLSLLIIACAAAGANFFKKNKLNYLHFTYLVVFGIALALNTYLHLSAPATTPTWTDSWQVFVNQLTDQNQFHATSLLIGSPAQQYADVYAQYSPLAIRQSFNQAANYPLTILTMFGLVSLLAWLTLIGKTLHLCFKKGENNNHLYFILLLSFIVQFFTSIHPLILFIQALIIAFATDKNTKTLVNLSFSTVSDRQTTDAGRQKTTHWGLYAFATLMIGLDIFALYKLCRTYAGYFYTQLAINDLNNQDVSAFYAHAQTASRTAANLDTTHYYAAIADLEMFLQNLDANSPDNQTALSYFYQADEHAKQAITINPHHAANYTLQAQIYQEIYSHLNDGRDTISEKIVSSYAQALLLQPYDVVNFLELAGFYQSIGGQDDALKFYQQAINLDPTNPLSSYQLAQFYEQQGNQEMAYTTYQHTLELLDADSANYAANQAQLTVKLEQLSATTTP